MNTPLGITLKHVDQEGNAFYIAAHYIKMVWPKDGSPSYAIFDAGDRLESGQAAREIRGGQVYIMNSSGKTIDVLTLDQVMPQPMKAA